MTTGALQKKNTLKLLAVDDSDFVLDLIRFAFRNTPVDVVGTTSVKEALREMGRNRFCMIIADMKMPGMGGLELLEEIRKFPACEKVPVLMLSGYDEAVHKDAALAAGAFGFMKKPFSSQDLTEIVLGHLQAEAQKTSGCEQ
jgi:two-component system, chemotaxis family, chemotaxis protein CheY